MANEGFIIDNQVLADNGEILTQEVAVSLETKVSYNNITSSVTELKISGIKREPTHLSWIRTSAPSSNYYNSVIYDKNMKTQANRSYLLFACGSSTSYNTSSDNNDNTKPNWKWDSSTQILTLSNGNSKTFYGNYIVSVVY